jgi:hypothetical protein
MDTIEKQSLVARTRQRNALTWLPLDYGGIMDPLASMEADLDTLAVAGIENFMAISDETWGTKEDQRDRTIELSQNEIDQDVALADAKAATGRAKLAIERTADEYVLAVKVYDAQARSLLMEAKEYAALAELEQLANDADRASLAVDKEALRAAKIRGDILLEGFQAAMVQADIARAQLDVARANIRAAMAGVEAGRISVDIAMAGVQLAMTAAQSAELQADVAMILAEIVTTAISKTVLGVGKEEIQQGFALIATKLADAVALFDAKKLIAEIKVEAEEAMAEAVTATIEVEVVGAEIGLLEPAIATEVMEYEKAQSAAYLEKERAASAKVVEARNAVHWAHKSLSVQRDSAHTVAQGILDAAHINTYGYSTRITDIHEDSVEYISK